MNVSKTQARHAARQAHQQRQRASRAAQLDELAGARRAARAELAEFRAEVAARREAERARDELARDIAALLMADVDVRRGTRFEELPDRLPVLVELKLIEEPPANPERVVIAARMFVPSRADTVDVRRQWTPAARLALAALLDDDTEQTIAAVVALAPDWTGTHDELVDAARLLAA